MVDFQLGTTNIRMSFTVRGKGIVYELLVNGVRFEDLTQALPSPIASCAEGSGMTFGEPLTHHRLGLLPPHLIQFQPQPAMDMIAMAHVESSLSSPYSHPRHRRNSTFGSIISLLEETTAVLPALDSSPSFTALPGRHSRHPSTASRHRHFNLEVNAMQDDVYSALMSGTELIGRERAGRGTQSMEGLKLAETESGAFGENTTSVATTLSSIASWKNAAVTNPSEGMIGFGVAFTTASGMDTRLLSHEQQPISKEAARQCSRQDPVAITSAEYHGQCESSAVAHVECPTMPLKEDEGPRQAQAHRGSGNIGALLPHGAGILQPHSIMQAHEGVVDLPSRLSDPKTDDNRAVARRRREPSDCQGIQQQQQLQLEREQQPFHPLASFASSSNLQCRDGAKAAEDAEPLRRPRLKMAKTSPTVRPARPTAHIRRRSHGSIDDLKSVGDRAMMAELASIPVEEEVEAVKEEYALFHGGHDSVNNGKGQSFAQERRFQHLKEPPTLLRSLSASDVMERPPNLKILVPAPPTSIARGGLAGRNLKSLGVALSQPR